MSEGLEDDYIPPPSPPTMSNRFIVVAVCTDRFNICMFNTVEEYQPAVDSFKAYEMTRYIFIYDGGKLVRTFSGKARPH